MNDELYQMTLRAITRLFSDKSVPQAETRRRLNDLIGEIEIMIDTLEDGEGDDESND